MTHTLADTATTIQSTLQGWNLSEGWAMFLAAVIHVALVAGFFGLPAGIFIWAERKISGRIQDRLGPTRVGGKFGWLQAIADGGKLIQKEDLVPEAADGPLFRVAPYVVVVSSLAAFMFLPFSDGWIAVSLDIGLYLMLAVMSLEVIGVILAGYASGSKWALFGGMREAAQMVSYEVALGLSLIVVLMMAGNVTLTGIVWQQQQLGFWFAFPLSLGFILFVVSAFAETNRLPFDMPEAESELITGFHTEYSAMKFSMFFIAEYAHMLTASALMATLFWGGWDLPGSWDDAYWYRGDLIRGFDESGATIAAAPAVWKTLLTFAAFALKTAFFLFLYIWIRWTVPRFRYDQVMQLGWKIMLPTALAYLMVVAGTILVLDQVEVSGFAFGLTLTGVSVICTVAFVFFLDRGRIIGGAASPSKPGPAILEPTPGDQGMIAGEGTTVGD